MRARWLPAFAVVFLVGAACGPKAPAKSANGGLVRPAPVQEALLRIEDPLAGASRIRVAVRLVRSGEDAAKAEWSGWLPLDGKAVVAEDTDEQGLGELQMVVDMIRPSALLGDLLSARLYRWTKDDGVWRGTVEGGGYVSVRFDDRKRISFLRTNAPGRPPAIDIRYDGKSDRISEIDVHDEGLDLGMRWTQREGGLLDLDVGAATDEAAGEIHVRVLEIDPPHSP